MFYVVQTNSTNNDLTLGSEPRLSGPLSLGVLRWGAEGKQIRYQISSSKPCVSASVGL